jgi:DNA polymerase-3 subunit epsilon
MISSLAELKILAIDCQATGANPQKGRLLELGWLPVYASRPETLPVTGVQSYLACLPDGEKIPRAVSRITGISDESILSGSPSSAIWRHLMQAVEKINSENQMDLCPTVIHFARFETPFLEDLHHRNDPTIPFPFQIICTHEIAIRLLPDLPRRGLRAIAGYFNHSMPELKRSADHVTATAMIWKKMIEILSEKLNVYTLSHLRDWLTETKPAGRPVRIYPMADEKRRRLPHKPGIYRMLRSNGDLLYIGKARSLKSRVDSYFRPKAPHAEHILEMLTQAQELDFTLTETALESAILESDEIKHHSPPYNIALRRRQRKLAFISKDLWRYSMVYNRFSSIGPLPGGNFIGSLSNLGHWISRGCRWTNRDVADKGAALLGLAPEYAPNPDCLRQGLEIFRTDHRDLLKNQTPLRFLTGLGATFWRLKLEAAEEADAAEKEPKDAEGGDDQTEDTDEEYVWTPEAVSRSIGRLVMHSAHLVRRARWFCLLSESTLAWEKAEQPHQLVNLMVLEGGLVINRDSLKHPDEIPVPPGFDRPFHRRQSHLGLMTYDRLRVLTTELRRLISEDRRVELRLSPTATLGNEELKRALRWL